MDRKAGTRPTASDLIMNLIKAKLGKTNPFKEFYFGDPVAIPEPNLPALVVDETSTTYNQGATMSDDLTHEILIQVIFNKKDDFGKPGVSVAMSRKLQEIVQARDETTGDLLDTSILGILRHNLTFSGMVIENISDVRFGVIPRPQDVWTAEAHVIVRVNETIFVNSR